MKVCLAVVCIGDSYIHEFNSLFKKSLEEYCSSHGYDLKVFTGYLDDLHRHPSAISFQKALVPSHESLQEYDRVAVIDADIYMMKNSPPLPLTDKIGIVNEFGQIDDNDVRHLRSTIGIPDYPTEYYAKCGFEVGDNVVLNTGLMICKPREHGQFLKDVYFTYIGNSINHPRGFHYEQSCIGYELIKNQMYTLIPNEWNTIYLFSSVLNRTVKTCYGIHFAGMRGSQRANEVRRLGSLSFLWSIRR